ncbi:ComF family protein [Arthrobacter woluwensis]|uniref:Predicted amidophosphoribosyltransferases n=1 Tax=Arthrobacter woluwensis TaxID=156980 RepID=A0A1H4MTZ1_9MICC|nr:phosphoribosyltransferase family protein [Arthrobacter woluwensis]SEB86630.1 Predicted amidophosphoribosyltransferases [Arthrobacter woluwensis]
MGSFTQPVHRTGRRAADRTGPSRAVAVSIEGLSAMASLVTGAECVACGQTEVVLCTACRSELHAQGLSPFAAGHRAPALADRPEWTVLAAADYGGVVSQVVLAQKRRGHRVLTRELGALLHRAMWAFAGKARGAVGPERPGELWFVPVPSSGASFRKRGFDPLALVLSGCAATGLPPDSVVVPVLAVRGLPERLAHALLAAARPRDGDGAPEPPLRRLGRALLSTLPGPGNGQKGLGAAARRRRLAGSMRLSRAFRCAYGADALKGARCVLVDDVLTTGATLAEAGRVLQGAGARVLGAVAIAATRPPADRGSSQEEISEQGMNY